MKTFSLLVGLLFAAARFTTAAPYALEDENFEERRYHVDFHQPIGDSGSVSRVLFKRADVPLPYPDAIAKGCARINKLNNGRTDPSLFQDNQARDPNTGALIDVLNDNGWDVKISQAGTFAPSTTLADLAPVFNGLMFSTSDNDNPYIEAEQSRDAETHAAYGSQYPVGTEFGASYGYYFNVYNLKNGALIAAENFSPATVDSSATAPPLNKLSDVQWLVWKSEADKRQLDASNLRWYFRHHIANSVTTEIIDTVLAMQNPPLDAQTVGTWPGKTITMDTDEGKAILGTVHGSGPYFLVGQHFSTRTIQSVNVFVVKNSDGSLYKAFVGDNFRVVYNLAFKIVPR